MPYGQTDLDDFVLGHLASGAGQIGARLAGHVHSVHRVGEPKAVGAAQIGHDGEHGQMPAGLLLDLLARQGRDVAHEGVDRHDDVRFVREDAPTHGPLAHDLQVDVGHQLERLGVGDAVHELPLRGVGGQVRVPRREGAVGGTPSDATTGTHW